MAASTFDAGHSDERNALVSVETRLFEVPRDEVLVDARHGDHSQFELITVTVRLADGSEGTGYTYTGGRGGRAIRAMIQHDLAPFVKGRDGDAVEALNQAMYWHVHYVGVAELWLSPSRPLISYSGTSAASAAASRSGAWRVACANGGRLLRRNQSGLSARQAACERRGVSQKGLRRRQDQGRPSRSGRVPAPSAAEGALAQLHDRRELQFRP